MQFKVFQAGHEEHIRGVAAALFTQVLKNIHLWVAGYQNMVHQNQIPFINTH